MWNLKQLLDFVFSPEPLTTSEQNGFDRVLDDTLVLIPNHNWAGIDHNRRQVAQGDAVGVVPPEYADRFDITVSRALNALTEAEAAALREHKRRRFETL